MYPGLQQISREQFGAAIDYLTRPPPESRYDSSTSLAVTVPVPLFPFMRLGSALIEEMVDAGNPAPTLSAPLTQEYEPITPPVRTPGMPQPYPPTWASQTNTASPATTTGNPKECPICHDIFTRWQDRDRHLVTHLPHWIHCPISNCTWRGNRVRQFEDHWGREHRSYHIPGRNQFEIFDPQEFVNQINAGTIPVVATGRAIERVLAKAGQLGKPSMSKDPWGWKIKRPPQ
ncbi:hypothetical protein EDB87DRAFT_1820639 [Lactarius vividus]|nr:hypothetical protein EDB87DRAFT_1820639 [Lactarius vividus]